MNTLRVAEQNEERDRHRVVRARKTAVDVAADAALQRRSRALTAEQLDALEEAAPHAHTSLRQLDQATRGNGNCAGEDSREFYPVFREDPAIDVGLAEERALAGRLCGGCPVRGRCLAMDFVHADGRVQQIWGIAGGLVARDRRVLLPLWVDLVHRLDAADADQTAESAAVAAGEGQTAEAVCAAVAS
jgi:hypothetical protein